MMKKIIALALALSMALSMVAFAGYTDADKINADLSGDIELVTALGIMTGNPDGSFNPTGTLTRGEAAVIVYRLSAGKEGIDASWGDASLSSLTDMAGHWAAPYVNYCTALGLINGYTDKTFRPDNYVTAVEMAKMLLNVAGYDSDKQEYTNPTKWPASALADASNAGLFDDFTAPFTATATREWVAKLVANMVTKVQTVSYNAYTDALVKNTKNDEPVMFGAEKYGFTISDPIMARAIEKASYNGAALADEGKSHVGSKSNPTEIDYEIPVEMLGHNVEVYFKDKTGNGLSKDDTIYSVVDVTETVVTTADKLHWTKDTSDDLYYLYINNAKTTTTLTKDSDGNVTGSDLKYALVSLTENEKFLNALYTPSSSSKLADSREVTLVDKDGDGKYEAAFCNLYNYAIVDTLDTDEEIVKLVDANSHDVASIEADEDGNTDGLEWAQINFVDEVEEGDVVRYETVWTAEGKQINVTVVKPMTSALDSKVGTTKFTVSGTTYVEAATVMEGWAYAEDFLTGVSKNNLGDKVYDIYADGKYVFYAVPNDGADVTGLNMNLAIVIAKSKAASTVFDGSEKIQVMLANGDIAIYEYDADDDEIAFADADVDSLYNYVLNDDGTITFTDLAVNADHGDNANVTTASSAEYVYNKNITKSYLKSGEKNYYASANTILFVKMFDKDSEGKATKNPIYSVVEASEILNNIKSDFTFTTFGYTEDDDTGLTTLVYAVMLAEEGTTDMPGGTPTAGDYFIATGSATHYQTASDEYWSVSGINANGEKETLSLDSVSSTYADPKKNNLYKIVSTGEETYLEKITLNDTLAAGWNKATITAATNSVVMIGNVLYDVADDVNIIYVYKNSSGTATVRTGLSTIPHSDSATALVCMEQNGEDLVVTDLIITLASSTSAEMADSVVK